MKNLLSILKCLMIALLLTGCTANVNPIRLEVWSSDAKLVSGTIEATNEQRNFEITIKKDFKYAKCEDGKKSIYTKTVKDGLWGRSILEGNTLKMALTLNVNFPPDSKLVNSEDCHDELIHLTGDIGREVEVELSESFTIKRTIGSKKSTGEYLLLIKPNNILRRFFKFLGWA